MLNLMVSKSGYRASTADLEKFHILANTRNFYCEEIVLIIYLSFPISLWVVWDGNKKETEDTLKLITQWPWL